MHSCPNAGYRMDYKEGSCKCGHEKKYTMRDLVRPRVAKEGETVQVVRGYAMIKLDLQGEEHSRLADFAIRSRSIMNLQSSGIDGIVNLETRKDLDAVKKYLDGFDDIVEGYDLAVVEERCIGTARKGVE